MPKDTGREIERERDVRIGQRPRTGNLRLLAFAAGVVVASIIECARL